MTVLCHWKFQPKRRLMISLFTLLYELIYQKNEVELFMIVLQLRYRNRIKLMHAWSVASSCFMKYETLEYFNVLLIFSFNQFDVFLLVNIILSFICYLYYSYLHCQYCHFVNLSSEIPSWFDHSLKNNGSTWISSSIFQSIFMKHSIIFNLYKKICP